MEKNEIIENSDTPSSDYIKGFNEGYLIEKNLPELAEKLSSSLSQSDRSKGFGDGRKEMMLEMAREKYPSWLKDDITANQGIEEDIQKDQDKKMDNLEPEH